jgi:hypothetical protein
MKWIFLTRFGKEEMINVDEICRIQYRNKESFWIEYKNGHKKMYQDSFSKVAKFIKDKYGN